MSSISSPSSFPYSKEVNELYSKIDPYLSAGYSKVSDIAKAVYDFVVPLLLKIATFVLNYAEAFFSHVENKCCQFKEKSLNAYEQLRGLVENVISGKSFHQYQALNDKEKGDALTKSFLLLLTGYVVGVPSLINYSVCVIGGAYLVNQEVASSGRVLGSA